MSSWNNKETRSNVNANAYKSSGRLIVLLLGTGAGIAVGVMGDYLAGDMAIGVEDILASLVLSPLAVTFGGKAVSVGPRYVFVLGGLLFWPAYGLLAWYWIRTGRRLFLLSVFFWCVQGFFQVVHRFHMIMSV